MADSRLKIDIRREKILEYLNRDGKVWVSDLSKELGVTLVTVRNDLNALEKDGYLERIQGGAVRRERSTTDPFEGRRVRTGEKREIARAASDWIKDGTTLFISSGTTTRYFAEELKNHKNLNVVTNSVAVALELSRFPLIHSVLLGGEVSAQYGFTYGGDTQEQIQHYQADWAILSIDGISAQGGVTTFHGEEASVNRLMIERARNTLILADYTKVGRTGFTHLCGVGPEVHLITDKKCSEEAVEELRKAGTEVRIV